MVQKALSRYLLCMVNDVWCDICHKWGNELWKSTQASLMVRKMRQFRYCKSAKWSILQQSYTQCGSDAIYAIYIYYISNHADKIVYHVFGGSFTSNRTLIIKSTIDAEHKKILTSLPQSQAANLPLKIWRWNQGNRRHKSCDHTVQFYSFITTY